MDDIFSNQGKSKYFLVANFLRKIFFDFVHLRRIVSIRYDQKTGTDLFFLAQISAQHLLAAVSFDSLFRDGGIKNFAAIDHHQDLVLQILIAPGNQLDTGNAEKKQGRQQQTDEKGPCRDR